MRHKLKKRSSKERLTFSERKSVTSIKTDLLSEINNAQSHLSHLKKEYKESTIQQETCRHHARMQRIIELQFRKQVLEMRKLSHDLRSESGAKRWFGLQNHQMGRHKRAGPLDNKATQLIQESLQKEQESQTALDQATLCKREVERLINHAMAQAIYRTELDQEQAQVKSRINFLTAHWEEAKLRLKQIRIQESALQSEEWTYGDHALELFSTAHSDAANVLDQQIRNMEN